MTIASRRGLISNDGAIALQRANRENFVDHRDYSNEITHFAMRSAAEAIAPASSLCDPSDLPCDWHRVDNTCQGLGEAVCGQIPSTRDIRIAIESRAARRSREEGASGRTSGPPRWDHALGPNR